MALRQLLPGQDRPLQIIRRVGPARKVEISSTAISMREMLRKAEAHFVLEGLINVSTRTTLTDTHGNSLMAFPSVQMYVDSIPGERLSRITIILQHRRYGHDISKSIIFIQLTTQLP